MRLRALLGAAAIVVAVAVLPATGTAAQWYNYYGPSGIMYPTQSESFGQTGWNYWTNNRVYRPLGYNFRLGYITDCCVHNSATNTTDNPFYWAPYGYSMIDCQWVYNGSQPYVYPVTCQGYR